LRDTRAPASLAANRRTIHQEISMRYTVVLEREEDGGYVASVPALPGCVSQGDTRAEALKNIQEAIALYVEDCRDAGDPVPTEAGKEFVGWVERSETHRCGGGISER
jgi:predicted RNase H-like HicB family nuclease